MRPGYKQWVFTNSCLLLRLQRVCLASLVWLLQKHRNSSTMTNPSIAFCSPLSHSFFLNLSRLFIANLSPKLDGEKNALPISVIHNYVCVTHTSKLECACLQLWKCVNIIRFNFYAYAYSHICWQRFCCVSTLFSSSGSGCCFSNNRITTNWFTVSWLLLRFLYMLVRRLVSGHEAGFLLSRVAGKRASLANILFRPSKQLAGWPVNNANLINDQ